MLCDTLGLIRALMVVPADAQDRAGGPLLMDRLRAAVKRLKVVWGDTHFDTALAHGWVGWGWVGVAVRKAAGQVGFVVQPRGWVVERTSAWLGRSRRLSKEYERTTASSEAFIEVAMTHIMAWRLRRSPSSRAVKTNAAGNLTELVTRTHISLCSANTPH